ncbi:MAG: hypothetical protein EX270_06135 [Pseudomonadales bacterium]|nr:MAG: hypothetical protein EX270_06135 [Pseudomonadales bacterium]
MVMHFDKKTTHPRSSGVKNKTRKRTQYGLPNIALLERARKEQRSPVLDSEKNSGEREASITACAQQQRRGGISKKALLGSVALVLATSQAHATHVFINEIHYDNNGIDVNEGVEIAGRAGQSVDGWELQLYNGGNGEVYRTLALASTFIDSYDGYGIIHVVTGSLQNGPADGFAIIDIDGDVVEFISYEGSVDAVNGGAVGMTSVDIGIAEDGDALEGESLQLIGMGSRASDFSWGTGTNSLGVANFGQTFKPGNSEVPLPASAWLFGTALASLRLAARDRQRKPA